MNYKSHLLLINLYGYQFVQEDPALPDCGIKCYLVLRVSFRSLHGV